MNFFIVRLMHAASVLLVVYWAELPSQTFAAEDAILAKLRTERAIDVSPKSIELLEAATDLITKNRQRGRDSAWSKLVYYWAKIGSYDRALALVDTHPQTTSRHKVGIDEVIAQLGREARFEAAFSLASTLSNKQRISANFTISRQLLQHGEIEQAENLLSEIAASEDRILAHLAEKSWREISIGVAKHKGLSAAEMYLEQTEKRLLALRGSHSGNSVYGDISIGYCRIKSFEKAINSAHRIDDRRLRMSLLPLLAHCLAAGSQNALAKDVIAEAEALIAEFDSPTYPVGSNTRMQILIAQAYLGETFALVKEVSEFRDFITKIIATHLLIPVLVERGQYALAYELLKAGDPELVETRWAMLIARKHANDGQLELALETADMINDPVSRGFTYADIALSISGRN